MSPGLGQQTRSPHGRLWQAFTTGGGVYPFKGVYVFLRSRHLWPLLKSRLFPCALLSLFILSLLFTFAYLPQVAILALFQRRGSAWFNGTILVLGEGAVLVALLFEAFFVDETQVDIFDAVLVDRGHGDLVATSRPVLPDEPGLNARTRLGKPTHAAVYYPFSFRQIVEFVILLPLNLVPYVGVPIFLLFTGWRAGPLLHWRYHKLKGMDRKTRKRFVRQRRWMYTWFGIFYLLLQLVPVFSMLFLLTSAAGSATWAADIEDQFKAREQRNQPVAGDFADDEQRQPLQPQPQEGIPDEPPPPYEDDPI